VVLAVVTSRGWREAPASTAARTVDRLLGGALLVLLVLQLVLGAALRHLEVLLLAHVLLGLAFVAPLALHVGFRAWGRGFGRPFAPRLGLLLAGAAGLQVVLGLLAFLGRSRESSAHDVLWTTAHQWFGAVLLALAVSLACWTFRAPLRK
jgi:hypothetical protein